MQGCFNLMPPKEWKDFYFGCVLVIPLVSFFGVVYDIFFIAVMKVSQLACN